MLFRDAPKVDISRLSVTIPTENNGKPWKTHKGSGPEVLTLGHQDSLRHQWKVRCSCISHGTTIHNMLHYSSLSADPGWSRGSALGKNSFRDCLLTVSAIVSSRVGCNQELNSSGSKRWFCFFAAAAAGAAGATRTAGHSNGSNSRHSQQGQWQQPLQ